MHTLTDERDITAVLFGSSRSSKTGCKEDAAGVAQLETGHERI
jgi:hypothetical protein